MATAAARSDAPTVVTVALGPRSYDILIGRNLLERAGAEIAGRMPGRARRRGHRRERSPASTSPRLPQASRRPASTSPPSPCRRARSRRASPTLATVVDGILAARIERSDLVIAFGGGVVGDLAGFAAVDRPARHARRADPHHAARPGRFLGRRQDRHQHRRAARTWSARSTSRAWCWPMRACSIR